MHIQRSRSLGDVLSDAKANLEAAGYTGVSCRKERVYFPGVDPNTGLNYYEQDICDAPGFTGGIMANVAANQANTGQGYGVDLAAERAYNIRQGGGDDASYFQTFGSAANVQVLNTLLADGTRVTGNKSAPTADQYQQVFDSRTPIVPLVSTPTAKTPTPTASTSTVNPSGSSVVDETISGLKAIDPIYLFGAAAVGLLLLLKK